MKKKPSKDIIIFQQTRPKPCSICQNPQSPLILNSTHLIKKFYLPQIQSYQFRSLNDIIFDPYSKNFMSYEQVLKDTNQQHVEKYNNWGQIVGSIKKVILKRCENDFYAYVDFKEECYDITLGSYLRKKQLIKRKKVHFIPYKSSLSTQQTAEDRNLLDCLESRVLNRHLQKVQAKKKPPKVRDSLVTNSSIIQLQKLTKNLDAMVDPILRKQHRSVKSKNNMLSPKKTKIPLQNNFINLKSFKKQLEKKQISVIDKNEQDLIVLDKDSENKYEAFLDMNDIKETYGLKVFKPQNPVKKSQKLFSSEKLSVPMTPKPRFQFTNNQYEQRFVAQTPKMLHKALSPQSPSLYRANCSSRDSTSSTKSLKKINSISSKKTTTKLKSPAAKAKK